MRVCLSLLARCDASVCTPFCSYGAWRVWFISMTFVCLGFVLYGLWSVYFAQHYPDRIWIAQLGPILGGSVVATSAGCFATPAYQVIVSKSVRPEEQATAQSMISMITRLVRKTPLFAPFIHKMHFFTKTGSGQT
jgi:hypothetical protein